MDGTSTTISYSTTSCAYCGGQPAHTAERCPNVRVICYRKDGTIKSVEKHALAPNYGGGLQFGTYTINHAENGR